MIYLNPKKTTSFVADVTNVCNKPSKQCHLDDLVLEGLVIFASSLHRSWVEMKYLLEAKSDNNLAHHLLAHFAKTLLMLLLLFQIMLLPNMTRARTRGYPSLPNVMK